MTRWPTVDRSPTPTGWARPGNLMPAVGPSSWPRGRRAMTEAEEILATAEAWWDVDRSNFRDGDRFLRNIGTAGSALDLRLGSSGVANSNDPKYLAPEDTGYVYLPGVAANRLSVPSATALDITGDLSIVLTVAPDSWTPSADNSLLTKDHQGAAANRSWYLNLTNTGTLQFVWWDSGGTARVTTSNASISAQPGVVLTVRVSLQVNNGAGGHVVTIYTSTNFGSTWTQLGTTLNAGAFTTSVQVTTAAVQLGAAGAAGTSAMLSGKVYRASVYSDVTLSTNVLTVDADAITSGAATTFTATTGQTVTINRATSGRKSVAMPSKAKGGRPCMLLGTDDYLECQDAAQHGLLNFGSADSFTMFAVMRPWTTMTDKMILSKAPSIAATMTGYIFYCSGTALLSNRFGDGVNRQIPIEPVITYGTRQMVGLTRNTFAKTRSAIINGASSGLGTDTTTMSLASRDPLFIGRAAATSYADMEFTAAAIFRRALTAREITVLNNAAPWGV